MHRTAAILASRAVRRCGQRPRILPLPDRHDLRRTVIHQIARHFGIDDNRLRELGW